ncbi:extracellular solute-binding protein [Streptomyces sp. NBC_01716]|uniref:extracellular solute-binding protein n=1 Tax=Streptomyces sp. NBC_01716 TaxID=2975917 RepID=UPI002E2EA88A|nr:extracellular solute-binding protein [Streptomyces sp. NBC_01716]
MTLTRRRLLAGATALGAAAFGAGGCSSPTTANPGHLTFWYTYNGFSENVLKAARKRFAADKFVPSQVSGDLTQRLLAALAGGAYLPDITMIGDNISRYFSDSDRFVNMNDHGARELAQGYLPWKWQAGATSDGFQLGFPIDIGPAALYYRHDIFEKAGLPSEPDDVAAAVPTWEKYFTFGEQIRKKLPGRYLITDTKTVFTYSMAQEQRKYFTPENSYLDDQAHVRLAWDRSVEAFRRRLTAGFGGSQTASGQSVDRHAAWNTGQEVSLVNASWITGEIKQSAPGTAGKWRVCAPPGGPGNQGGSFLAITAACPDPQAAFDIISWLQNPANQASNYAEIGLFPSSPAAAEDERITAPDTFFGGQSAVKVFADIADQVRYAYFSPWDITISDTYTDELTNVELGGKDPERAWKDARNRIERLLRRQGVLS